MQKVRPPTVVLAVSSVQEFTLFAGNRWTASVGGLYCEWPPSCKTRECGKRKRRIAMDRDGLANFFLGLGIGVGLGMLFAPKSGNETRELILNKADQGKEFIKKQTATLQDTANTLVEKGRDVIGRQRDTISDAVQAGKQAYREKVEPRVAENLPS